MPTILHLGPWSLHVYTLLLIAGLLAGLLVAGYRGTRRGIPASQMANACLAMLGVGLLLGRAAHVAVNWADYVAQPSAAWELGRPFALHGLLWGGFLGLLAYARIGRLRFWPLADAIAGAAPIVLAFGWSAGLFQGSAYGRVAYHGWTWQLPDIYGVVLPRIPTQAIGAAVAALLAVVLLSLKPRRPGMVWAAFLGASSLAYFALEFTRGDPTRYVGPLRISQVAYLAELAFAAAMAVVALRRGALTVTNMTISEEVHQK